MFQSFGSSPPGGNSPDFYKVLNVPRTATPAQIKQAYRSMAKKYHPGKQRYWHIAYIVLLLCLGRASHRSSLRQINKMPIRISIPHWPFSKSIEPTRYFPIHNYVIDMINTDQRHLELRQLVMLEPQHHHQKVKVEVPALPLQAFQLTIPLAPTLLIFMPTHGHNGRPPFNTITLCPMLNGWMDPVSRMVLSGRREIRFLPILMFFEIDPSTGVVAVLPSLMTTAEGTIWETIYKWIWILLWKQPSWVGRKRS
jgi:hypothetical protein